MGHQVAQFEAVFQNPHQQRNFQAYQHADGNHHQVQSKAEAAGVGEGQEEHRRGEAAHQADHQFNGHEAGDQRASHEAGHPASDAHGEEIGADDGGELQDAIA